MIFISHAWEDKEVVGPIAKSLSETYGQTNIFYDSWALQPGDSLIGGIEEGLEKTQFFFLFLSKVSQKKAMVKTEWQSALLDSIRGGMKFVLVLMEEGIQLEKLLADRIYIHMYENGEERTVQDIKNVIEGKNIFQPEDIKPFVNLTASCEVQDRGIVVTVKAKRYVEKQNYFCFYVSNSDDTFIIGLNEVMGYTNKVILDNNNKANTIRLNRDITPNHDVSFLLKASGVFDLQVYHIYEEGKMRLLLEKHIESEYKPFVLG